VAEHILLEPQAMRVFVRIEKLDRGPGALGVEIARSREQVKPHLEAVEVPPAPIIVFLSAKAIASERLKTCLDDWEQSEQPVILCLTPTDLEVPEAGHPLAQRRIDLLALEQAAWVLAARNKRCVVVDSRTELDWSTKNGQMAIWAPSKMVLDAVDGPLSTAPEDLVLWLASELNVTELMCVDVPVPAQFLGQAHVVETDV
jgi:dihydroneopterin aldolase